MRKWNAMSPNLFWNNCSKAVLLGATAAIGICGPSVAQTARSAVTLIPPAETVCTSCARPDAIAAPMPPANFDPVTASDDALAYYGYPPRPDPNTAPGAYATWKMVMTGATRRINSTFQTTTIFNGPAKDLSTRPAKGNGARGTSSSNWSGYAIVDTSDPFKTTNTTTYGAFVIPTAQQAFGTTCSGNVYSSQWVGVDGDGSDDVFQAGIEADAGCSSTFYSAWYEWYPNSETRISNFTVTAGDLIYVYIWNTSLTEGDYYIADLTANTNTTAQFGAPNGTHLTGNSAEWIVERPGVGGKLATLTNYTTVPWYDSMITVPTGKGKKTTEYSPGKGNGGIVYSITMDDNSNQPISGGYTSPNDKLTYVEPTGKTERYDGTALWFFNSGSSRGQ